MWHWLERELAVVTVLTTPGPLEFDSDGSGAIQSSGDLDQAYSMSGDTRTRPTDRSRRPSSWIRSGSFDSPLFHVNLGLLLHTAVGIGMIVSFFFCMH